MTSCLGAEHLQQPMPRPCGGGKYIWAASCCDNMTNWAVHGVCAADLLQLSLWQSKQA